MESINDTDDNSILKWQKIKTKGFLDPSIFRAKVYGGWLVARSSKDSGITFIPDPEHKWKIQVGGWTAE